MKVFGETEGLKQRFVAPCSEAAVDRLSVSHATEKWGRKMVCSLESLMKDQINQCVMIQFVYFFILKIFPKPIEK